MNRAPSVAWFMRRLGRYPNGYVRTGERDTVQVVYFHNEHDYDALMLSRRDARLLAKRINQCLDRTVRR